MPDGPFVALVAVVCAVVAGTIGETTAFGGRWVIVAAVGAVGEEVDRGTDVDAVADVVAESTGFSGAREVADASTGTTLAGAEATVTVFGGSARRDITV
jgi:hypothetical protein